MDFEPTLQWLPFSLNNTYSLFLFYLLTVSLTGSPSPYHPLLGPQYGKVQKIK